MREPIKIGSNRVLSMGVGGQVKVFWDMSQLITLRGLKKMIFFGGFHDLKIFLFEIYFCINQRGSLIKVQK